MTADTLECLVAAYLQAHPTNEVIFGWQGGEPLLMGIDFFRRVRELQNRYQRPEQRVMNTLQTNGTLITAEWAAFFKEEQFLVGISLDGPSALHDTYRRNQQGLPTHDRVEAGVHILLRHGVEANALVTVNRENAGYPLEVYQYLTGLGLAHLQFIPIVEQERPAHRKVTAWSVRADAYSTFLCTIFDYWARHDVGQVFVQLFESALQVWLGGLPTVCAFAPTCGRALVVEHTGALYACDHFVEPGYYRGLVTSETLPSLVDGPQQIAFGQHKADLSSTCRCCQVRRFCGGDCPKHRLRQDVDGKPISYLCAGYQHFFTHSAVVLQAMAVEIRHGRQASNVMAVLQMDMPSDAM